jgi:hypothetical protein
VPWRLNRKVKMCLPRTVAGRRRGANIPWCIEFLGKVRFCRCEDLSILRFENGPQFPRIDESAVERCSNPKSIAIPQLGSGCSHRQVRPALADLLVDLDVRPLIHSFGWTRQ